MHRPGAEAGRRWLVEFLGLEWNVALASAAIFLLTFGEELWQKFLPKYLEVLGASPLLIGLFGSFKNLLDALYPYPGGWLADHFGRKYAFQLFLAATSLGYLIYLFSPSYPLIFVGLVFVMVWDSMGSSALFAIIGDALPQHRRTIAFTFQSIIKRIPMVVAPLIGGMLIGQLGISSGTHTGLVITLCLAAGSFLLLSRMSLPSVRGTQLNVGGIWSLLHQRLKRVLISDVLARAAQALIDVFVVLYVTNVLGISITQYALLVAIQLATSIAVYIPAAKIADRIGRKPFVFGTFLCFGLFPLAIILAGSFHSLVLAFVIGGLREIGEPARKAMIVDFALPHARGRTVGLYYLIRSLMVTPAGLLGGALWTFSPSAPFVIGGAIGLLGTAVFAVTVEEQYAA